MQLQKIGLGNTHRAHTQRLNRISDRKPPFKNNVYQSQFTLCTTLKQILKNFKPYLLKFTSFSFSKHRNKISFSKMSTYRFCNSIPQIKSNFSYIYYYKYKQ